MKFVAIGSEDGSRIAVVLLSVITESQFPLVPVKKSEAGFVLPG